MSLRRAFVLIPVLTSLAGGVGAEPADPPVPLRWFPPERREAQRQYERALLTIPETASLAAHHELLASFPHPAGTSGDAEEVERLVRAYQALGLTVERHEVWTTVPRFRRGEAELMAPERRLLPTQEPARPEDPYTTHPGLQPGWLAWSGSGEAEGEVVYANYGRQEDFAQLAELGVEVGGKVVVMRYGKLYRGHKARNAERAGAAAAVLYTDPEEYGWRRGIPYPEGGWHDEHSIQRGSLDVRPYPGDALTPGIPATREAPRLDPSRLDLLRIPVQPLGWGAAAEILSRLRGPGVPEGWQGGLPFAYRVSGGQGGPRVRIAVEQELGLVRTESVLATLRGRSWPNQKIIVGSHHDAWSFGASDPNAGSIVVYEVARAFAELARRGAPPERTLVFAHWGAEELGIIGSTEWVEANLPALSQEGVAYFNLDSAAMGTRFRADVAPSLGTVLREAMAAVELGGEVRTVLDAWEEESRGEDGQARFGALGGGSDHVAFYTHAGVPSANLGTSGGDGSAYHTNYDTLRWYRQSIDGQYQGALILSRVLAVAVARLANAAVVPLDPAGYEEVFVHHLADLGQEAPDLLAAARPGLVAAAEACGVQTRAALDLLFAALESGRLTPETLAGISWELIQLERLWLDPAGLAERPWYRSLLAAPDPHTSYAPWMLPALRYGVELGDGGVLRAAGQKYLRVFRLLEERMKTVERMVEADLERADTTAGTVLPSPEEEP